MNQIQKPEPKELNSALNISEWIQFIKDECNSLEEERRFLITQYIALITTIAILIWALIELLINQISFDLETTNIFKFKIVFTSFILVFSFQIYKIISLLYAVTLSGPILRIINAPSIKEGNVSSFPIILIFLIIMIHRLSPLFFSIPTVSVQILESISYLSLVLISGLETGTLILVIAYERRFSKVFEETQISNKTLKTSLAGGVLYQFLILLLIIWILLKLELPPYELIELQLKFGLVITSILFILIYWAKPVYFKLKEIAIRLKNLHDLLDEILHGEISKPEEIIIKRDKSGIY